MFWIGHADQSDYGDAGTAVVCPTMEGMTGESLETLKGEVTLRLWRGDELLLEATSAKAALAEGMLYHHSGGGMHSHTCKARMH